MTVIWTDLVGYTGAMVIAIAYLLNQRGKLDSQGRRFPAMNLFGSMLVMVSLVFRPNLPSIIIELFWSSISLYGVLKRHPQPSPD